MRNLDLTDMAPTGDTIVKGLPAVAAHFGKSVRQVQRWVKYPGFPRLSGRRFDLIQVQAWLDARDGQPPAPRGVHQENPQQPFLSEEPQGKKREEARFKRLSADIKELELKKLKGELIPLAEVEALLTPRAMVYRQGIVSMQTLAPEIGLKFSLPPEAVRAIATLIAQRGREVLANVLRPLTLAAGQVLEWGQDLPQGDG